MYEFSGRLKVTALVLMVIGALGIGFGFFDGASKTMEDAKEVIAHHEAVAAEKAAEAELKPQYGRKSQAKAVEKHAESHDTHGHDDHADAHAEDKHVAHVLHQLHNRPWAAVLVAMFYLFMIALSIFAFYTIQIAASAGWSVVLLRLMEALSASLVPIGILIFIFLLASAFGMNHIYPWMHAEGDAIIEGKKFWLNIPGWLLRSFVVIAGFIFFRYIIIKKNREQDDANDLSAHKKGFKYAVFFLAFFMVAETVLSWDWIMSLDPHWFSSLFGWYVFSTAIVSAITVIALAVIYLKIKGHLEFVNDSHIHDLGKYMFGFSIFWTYLWFSQYMLIWYANMPEETTYFVQRMEQYQFIFYFMVVLNLVFPLIILMDSDLKRKFTILSIVGVVILIGHYIDVFVMIMPSAVGPNWHFGIPEIGSILFFVGMFIYFGFKSLEKRPLLPKGNPYLKESKHFHYYNLEHSEDSDH